MTQTKRYAIHCSTEEQARELISVYKEKGFVVPGKKHRTKEMLFEIDNTGFHVVRPTTIGTNYVVITYEEAKSKGLLGTCKECNGTGIWSSDEGTNSYCNCEIGRIKNDTLNQVISKKETTEPQQEEDVIEKIMELALDYVYVDGGHHKQYALVEIIKIIDKSRLPKDIEEGIPG